MPRVERQPLTPSQRSQRARLAAYAKHAKHDPKESTSKARQAFYERFEREVDPDGILDTSERKRRAESALKAHMTRLSFASSKVRSRRSEESVD